MLYNANHSGLLLTQSNIVLRSYNQKGLTLMTYKSLGKEAERTYINKNHNYHRIICKTTPSY